MTRVAAKPAEPATAADHFRHLLSFETDPADLRADMEDGNGGFLVLDVRAPEHYAAGHIPGSISFPAKDITAQTTRDLPRDAVLVTYCWGPGCNAADKGALKLAELGFTVKKLIGGFQTWKWDRHPIETGTGQERR
ncbi:rhodanese-like domain-containing protein [Allokutzneria sp. A3M-2-11 16]|uniref:rhodanese-like domain-containing protein n=1 Tax=Allokutzneria sp. A3M-2-11 16 TaxID=2962043 RepID=UPI0020B77D14|nr:rhodanese-like domain-containing protein [Allokutzneria sp. A3M-2-11 16]MCP3798592.1 rhodanese-like domain-containing protein [Allokutzneria sp. A3M-2-11 16]